ncbi:hypothetical protein WA026_014866 [Henosepilachna vigintioctopunctata]|uniref:COMM domain-containing protein n=1 Tax=Henosepilachna vigintioctopunctata TaxID=420089 RepID=A0AAW1V1X4_9CUCU
MFKEVFASNALLTVSNSPIFNKFLHICCDELIEGKLVPLENFNNDMEWTTDDAIRAKKVVKDFFCNCALNETFHIEEDIPETIKKALEECYNIRQGDIQQYLIKASFLNSGHNIVENIDWKLKWILGTSKLSTVREPILQLTLGCVSKESDDLKPKNNKVNFELNLEQVNYLINELENVKAELQVQHE